MASGIIPTAIPEMLKMIKSLSLSPRIAIVGEAWGEHEAEARQPFVGPSGRILNGLLRMSGIARSECLVTNVFNLRPQNNDLKALVGKPSIPGYPALTGKGSISETYSHHIDRLFKELTVFHPTCIIALGGTALWALTKKNGIKKYRGTPLLSCNGKWKVLPSYHPAAVMREWSLRPIVKADLEKALREAAFPEVRRPRREIWIEPTLFDLLDFHSRYIVGAPCVAMDTETRSEQITEVSIAPDPYHAIVIPFYSRRTVNYWPTIEEELTAWEFVRMVLATSNIVGQNFMYDMQYFWRTLRIPSPRLVHDTMLLHHALQPEMEKSLGFLGSIYTDEPAWKFMRTDHSTLKEED